MSANHPSLRFPPIRPQAYSRPPPRPRTPGPFGHRQPHQPTARCRPRPLSASPPRRPERLGSRGRRNCCADGVTTTWLDGDAAYFCTAYSPSCFVIQKMRDTQQVASSSGSALNPEANVFNLPSSVAPAAKAEDVDISEEVHSFMNGDVGKLSCMGYCPLPDTTESQCSGQKIELEKAHLANNCGSAVLSLVTCSLPISDIMDIPTNENASESELDVHESNSDEHDVPELQIQSESISDVGNLVSTSHIGIAQGLKEFTGNDDTGQQLPVSCIPKDGSQHGEGDKETDFEPVGTDRKTLSREEIKLLISQQVEYFFSRENWSSDRYLLSQMDSDQYVPIYILANCSQFKSITKDHSIILDALKDSLYVQLDEEHNRVRPNYKRCIVILREIPESTPVKEVEAMFEGEGCPKALSCEFVHNEYWYVTFESDSDAQKAYRYLRETVKTFCDKPILARIKTKPMSRLGCLSVLPSYTGKPLVDQRDSPLPANGAALNPAPCVPPPPIMGPSVPNPPPPPPPSGAYAANSAQRVFFSQNGMNPSYNYNYAGSPQVPTAFFYPNPMMPWTSPNFYDINSFIQYNGLSPRATFKPPTATRYNNNVNNNRRNKSRDVKSETRLTNSGSNNNASSTRHNVPGSCPPCSISPHLVNSQLGPQSVNSHHSFTSQPTAGDNSSSNPRSNSSGCSTPNHINGNVTCVGSTYSQNDYQTNCQNNAFTTYCPLPNASNSRLESIDKTDSPISCSGGHASSNSSQEDLPPTSETATTNCSFTTTAHSAPNTSGDQNVPPCSQQSNVHPQIHHQPPLPQSHRNSYSNEPHNITSRETQPPRQMGYADNRNIVFAQKSGRYDSSLHSGVPMSRGGRRKLSRRDDDVNGHAGSNVNGRGPQRGSSQQNQEIHSKSSLEARKPQFELQPNLFPPLPTAEEIIPAVPVVTPEEKVPEVTSQMAWSNDTHTFSDVMKGTAKPKHVNNEKETLPQESVSLQPPTECRESKLTLTVAPAPVTTNQVNNSNEDASVSTSLVNANISKPSISPVTSDGSSKNNGQSTVASRQDRVSQNRDHRAVRDERRGAPPASARREREYVSNVARGGSRRENSNFSRQSGNKENRPQGRIWREDRPDPDGWITKTPRENRNNRDHRYQQHNHQHNSYENKNVCSKHINVMVNGDSSPPESPKLETESKLTVSTMSTPTTNAKVETNNSKNVSAEKRTNEEIMKEKESMAMNNNDGEHKPSWAKMALASKDKMERLSAELKEKEEQERIKKNRTTRPNSKIAERSVISGREKESKPFRRENFPSKEKERDGTEKAREFRGPDCRSTFRPRESIRPKSPK